MRIHYAIKSRVKSEELRFFLIFFILHSSFFIFSSCERDSYDTGEGTYSRMHTDYVTVKVHNDYVQSIITDDGKALEFSKGMTYDVQPVDTTLRWLLYYNDGSPIEIIGRSTMWLLKPIDGYRIATLKTDPVTVTSVWMAKNKSYLNLRLGLKTGNSDEQAKHTVALIRNGVSGDVVYYTLYHDQADIPQYYTQEYTFTVEAPEQKEIDLTINTYNGVFHKTFTVRE